MSFFHQKGDEQGIHRISHVSEVHQTSSYHWSNDSTWRSQATTNGDRRCEQYLFIAIGEHVLFITKGLTNVSMKKKRHYRCHLAQSNIPDQGFHLELKLAKCEGTVTPQQMSIRVNDAHSKLGAKIRQRKQTRQRPSCSTIMWTTETTVLLLNRVVLQMLLWLWWLQHKHRALLVDPLVSP